MSKTILITGSTDGIGLATAKSLVALGHKVLLHGRSASKLESAKKQLLERSSNAQVETYLADLSVMAEVTALAEALKDNHEWLDVLINNAGVFVVPKTVSLDGLDVRFAVNSIAPYLLTKQLLPILSDSARVINLSSAAQAPVIANDLTKPSHLEDGAVYAQSKLALTMWSRQLAQTLGDSGPSIVAVNPASFLDSKMVKEAYGRAGGDIQRGADILVKAALSEDFKNASGLYFDNDIGGFSSPHSDALNADKIAALTQVLDSVISNF